ncbi:hypothetical protein DL93DRAFT_424564 [Clavulina sp. PMI_390]|nr:hypothetical protein DL93DRAFT_424564 [Clavulina sp. PMI_390]
MGLLTVILSKRRPTQSLVYRALCKATSSEERATTADLLDRTREIINETWGASPTNERIWNALHKSEHISRNVKQFLWKCQHGTLKIGSYWTKMPGYGNRAECSLCGELETIDHILFECEQGAGEEAWRLTKGVLEQKGVPWPRHMNIHTIIGIPFASHKNKEGRKLQGASRLMQIAISETAFQI